MGEGCKLIVDAGRGTEGRMDCPTTFTILSTTGDKILRETQSGVVVMVALDRSLLSAATTCRLLLVHVALLLLALRDVLALDVVERQRVRRLVARDHADKVPERRLLKVPLGQKLEVPLRDDRGGRDLDLGLCGERTEKGREARSVKGYSRERACGTGGEGDKGRKRVRRGSSHRFVWCEIIITSAFPPIHRAKPPAIYQLLNPFPGRS